MKTSDRFKADATYAVEGPTVRLIADLQDRLYSEQRMSGDEMRDWANSLNAHLHSRFIEIDPEKLAPVGLEAALAEHYVRKFAQETGRAESEYRGKLWVSWDDEERRYDLRGEGIPAHPDLAAQYPNGWSLLDHISPPEASKLVRLAEPPASPEK